MSDTSQGPGWWLASDGRWYPPETWTGPPRQSDAAWPAAGQATQPGIPGQSSYPTYPTYPGYPGYQGYQSMPMVAPRQTNGMAVASLVCSCAGIIPFFFGLTCVLGIIFGFVARSQIRRTNGVQQGSGLALAGIIVGFSLIALFIILLIILGSFHFHTCAGDQNCNTD
jgi:hypothetical protein